MNIQPVNLDKDPSAPSRQLKVVCKECDKVVPITIAYCDLDGKPFQSYLCPKCKDELLS